MSRTPSSLLSLAADNPSPLPATVLRILVALVLSFFIWACIGKVDIVADATGRLVPKTLIKLAQPSELGTVSHVYVSEGQAVQKGAVLLQLDDTSVRADLLAAKVEEQEASLRLRRVRSELAGMPLVREVDDPSDLFDRTKLDYDTRKAVHQQALAQERSALLKLEADVASATEAEAKFRKVLPSYKDAESAYSDMAKLQLQSELAAQEHVRERIEHEQDYLSQSQTLKGLRAAKAQQEFKIAQVESEYLKELRQEESDLTPRLERARQERIKQEHRLAQLTLTAPADGVVKDMAIHAEGTVVTPGAVLLTLIPTDDKFYAEVWARNEDSGFVFPGQLVRLKVATYPFQKYGLLHGKVLRVSPDSSESILTSSLAAPALTPSSNNPSAGPPQYKVLVQLDSQQLARDGKKYPLRAGMLLTAEIIEGRRTVLEYLISPVRTIVDEAAKER